MLLLAFGLQSCASSGPLRDNSAAHTNSEHTVDFEDAQNLFAKVDLAESAYRQGSWQEAAGLYQQVLTEMPEDAYLWFRLGNTLTQQGDYDKAIQAFEASIQHDARQAKPWFNLATAHLLGAQLASLKAWQAMAPDDPARQAAQQRLDSVTQLLR